MSKGMPAGVALLAVASVWAAPAGFRAVDVILDAGKPAGEEALAVGGIESMPHIIGEIVGRWESGNVVDYMDRLLRDNRGGTRTGFPLSVVADLLFLIDLKEYSNQIEREAKS